MEKNLKKNICTFTEGFSGDEAGSPTLQWILYQLSYQGSPETTESPRANAGILVSGFGFQEEILGLVPTHWCEVMSWG